MSIATRQLEELRRHGQDDDLAWSAMTNGHDDADERWRAALRAHDVDGAWELFLRQYRRLIFAVIRHFTRDHDEVLEIFADVCGALGDNGLARLEKYWNQPTRRARFSTWLVAVTVKKVASTLIVRHVSFLRHFGVVHATSTAGP